MLKFFILYCFILLNLKLFLSIPLFYFMGFMLNFFLIGFLLHLFLTITIYLWALSSSNSSNKGVKLKKIYGIILYIFKLTGFYRKCRNTKVFSFWNVRHKERKREDLICYGLFTCAWQLWLYWQCYTYMHSSMNHVILNCQTWIFS